jgi:hypothetical protein
MGLWKKFLRAVGLAPKPKPWTVRDANERARKMREAEESGPHTRRAAHGRRRTR